MPMPMPMPVAVNKTPLHHLFHLLLLILLPLSEPQKKMWNISGLWRSPSTAQHSTHGRRGRCPASQSGDPATKRAYVHTTIRPDGWRCRWRWHLKAGGQVHIRIILGVCETTTAVRRRSLSQMEARSILSNAFCSPFSIKNFVCTFFLVHFWPRLID